MRTMLQRAVVHKVRAIAGNLIMMNLQIARDKVNHTADRWIMILKLLCLDLISQTIRKLNNKPEVDMKHHKRCPTV